MNFARIDANDMLSFVYFCFCYILVSCSFLISVICLCVCMYFEAGIKSINFINTVC